MTRLEKFLVGFILCLSVAFFVFVVTQAPKQAVVLQKKFGISLTEPSFGSSTVTESQVTCQLGVSTSVVAVQPGRTSFIAANTGGNAIFLCRRSAGCTATSGIMLAPSSTAGASYTQVDDYIGPYACTAPNGTSTLNFDHSF